MRLSHRLIGSLVLGVGLVSLIFAWNDIRGRERQLRADMAGRATAEVRSLDQTLVAAGEAGRRERLPATVEKFRARSQAVGVILYDAALQPAATTPALPEAVLARAHALALNIPIDGPTADIVHDGDRDLFVDAEPVTDLPGLTVISIVHDATSIRRQTADAWRQQAVRLLIQLGVVVAVAMVLVRWSFIRPIARTTAWLRELRTYGSGAVAPLGVGEIFKPLASEVTHLVRSLESARAAAQEEARLREAGDSVWTAERLRAHVRERIGTSPVFVVSNREPYMHVRHGGTPKVVVPASGLVTALEPVLRACAGTWVAHGSGDADRDVVDTHSRLRVPPEQPEYMLRRVWLSKEEEEGYYDGFANEGLWPLCHIAHTRPIFRTSDYSCYREANQKFADAVLDEARDTTRPLVLVQDYHFALLPRLIKSARPDARVAIFWHIPWPNPEAFGICPWQSELLDGLLGADLVGFHTQAHCNNFLDTVERGLESQTDWEHFTARRHNRLTHVRPFPISVAARHAGTRAATTSDEARETVFRQIGGSCEWIGVGVDRVDYTKGLIERFRGLERFFEKWSHYLRRFTFVQIGAPSRTGIGRYRELLHDVQNEAARINARFGTAAWKPIVLVTRHHGYDEIEPFYRAADVCAVTSLHDGMNLVAKEYVMAREEGDGVLVLSQFTGAARELNDALIVNPYDTEQLADAFRRAIEMPVTERRARMERMRRAVSEHNVYRWAASLIGGLADLRVDAPPAPARPRLATTRRPTVDDGPLAESDFVA
ncbi:MAG TPA: trehalose-6-phosphate synthase [Vicinamibacterales bacterium]|nr:trehalose-6-phosphate synthase [Vicinamibacterales bacterium]